MRGERAERIGALRALHDVHAVEDAGMLGDEGHDAPRDIHRDGPLALRALRGVLNLSANGLERHPYEVGEKLDLYLVVDDV